MKLFSLFVLVTSSISFANTNVSTSFSVSDTSGRNRVYYDCSVVESMTEGIVEELGASVSSISCNGGFNPFSNFHRPNFVRVSMDVTAPSTNTTEKIVLKGNSNCHLASQVLWGVKRSLNITKIKGGNCFRPNSRYKITVTIKK